MGALFIVNPTAGKGKAEDLIPEIRKICSKSNSEYEIKLTTKPGDAEDLTKWGTTHGFERIVAVGGDGTLNEVVNGAVGSEVAVGIIPSGSGNDFIRTINMHKDINQIIKDNIAGAVKKIDLAKCNGRYFINIGSCGLDAEVAAEIQKIKKYIPGSGAYIAAALQTLFTYKGRKLAIEIDDKKFTANTLLIAISNGRFYGGGIQPTPKADIEDGYFDICFIKQIPTLKMFTLFPKFIKGKLDEIKEITFYRGKKIKLISERDIGINIDGEIIFDNVIEFEIIHKGINILVPSEE